MYQTTRLSDRDAQSDSLGDCFAVLHIEIIGRNTELQIRGVIEDNSKIIFLIS